MEDEDDGNDAGFEGDGRAYIEHLRRTKFMIGVQLPPDARAGAQSLRKSLSSALHLLSDDLYSKPTHFVLELIQNADDNDYDDGVQPSIRLSLKPTQLAIWNNERGFAMKNVRALCDVGRSTKAKQQGFIGEKGVGFKSVFRVSDKPEIHSNGFHFRFDMTNPDEHLGYIVPNWVEPAETVASEGTTIVLPAKSGGPAYADDTLAELDASLLLFLRKLRKIELETSTRSLTFRCVEDGAVCSLQTVDSTSDSDPVTVRLVRLNSTISMEGIAEEKRPKQDVSEMVLAFPLDRESNAGASESCSTFAFLPIRAFGFKFYIQADFLLSTSREDIQVERAWNVRLRDSIATSFVASIESFKTMPELARTYLRFLPRKAEISHPFFAPVVEKIRGALAAANCIPGASGKWRRPAEVLTAADDFQDLVPPSAAWEIYGKDYPARDLDCNLETLKYLGCTPLSYKDIVTLFGDRPQWLRSQTVAWLAKFYAYVSQIDRKLLLAAGFAEAAVVPLHGGGFGVPTDDRKIFFPLSDVKTFGFESDLLILREQFVQALKDDETVDVEAVYQLFRDVGVSDAVPYQVINDYILPNHEGGRWKTVGFEVLTGHVMYVKATLDAYIATAQKHGMSESASLRILAEKLRMKSKKADGKSSWFYPADELYLASEYGPDFDIEKILGSELDPNRIISADYITRGNRLSVTAAAEEAASWRTFLLRLGIHPSPRVVAGSNPTCSKELLSLLAHEKDDIRRQTLECLDRNWGRYSTQVETQTSGRTVSQVSAFALTLRSTITPTRQRKRAPLQEAFYSSNELREIFGDSPLYLDASIIDTRMLDACGVVHRPSFDACVRRLLQLSDAPKSPSSPQVRQIYRWIDRLAERREAQGLSGAFSSQRLIFVRGTEPAWRNSAEVVWSPPGDFLSAHFPSLSSQHNDLHSFFVRKVGVAVEVPLSASLGVLPELVDADLEQPAKEREALRLYVKASRALENLEGSSAPSWLKDFQRREMFLDQRGDMVALAEGLFANDQPSTASLFMDAADVSILAVAPERLPQIRALLDAAGVPLLSSSVSVCIDGPRNGVRNSTYTLRVRERYRHIARLLYSLHNPIYERAKADGRWWRLSRLNVVDMEHLTVEATLLNHERKVDGEVVFSEDTIYARVGVRGLADRIARELCSMLNAPDALIDAVSRILREEALVGVDEYLDVRGIPKLPADEADCLGREPSTQADLDESDGDLQPDDQPPGDSPSDGVEPEGGDTSSGDPDRAAKPVGEPSSQSSGAGGGAPASTEPGSPGRTGGTAPGTNSGVSGPPRAQSATSAPPWQGTPSTPSAPVALTSLPAQSGGSPGSMFPLPGGAAPSGAPGERGRSKKRHGSDGPGRRLISYVEPSLGGKPEADDREDNDEAHKERDATGKAAVQFFMSSQQDAWLELEEMPHFNKGFDIRAKAHDGTEHLIEVKGIAGAWTAEGVILTRSELACAQERRKSYWLAVVEFAPSDSGQRLHLINDPFGTADQFRFDSGWTGVAKMTTAVAPLTPEPGMTVEIAGEGSGRIASVKKAGMFFKMHVYMKDGRSVYRMFRRGPMALKKEG